MTEKKKIPCRVCGKPFEPCAICQSDNRMFRWRNFACSLECAEKYISDTIAYRESQKQKDVSIIEKTEAVSNVSTGEYVETPKRKYNKKKQIDNIEIVNEESEQID